jgi:hypothetical protein
LDRSRHPKDSAIKINIVPREGQKLTPPQAHGNPHREQCRQPMRSGGSQKRRGFVE